jgi:Zn-dependent peptidase ImmA (M78 family)
MNSVRDAILLGTRGAVETQTAFGLREKIEENGGAIDVFAAIEDLGVSLLFRPLDGLLGACIRLPDDAAGIIITTRRDLHMQRFTAAHELGHFVLEHEGSLDREVRFPGQTSNRNLQEVAADAFAAEFLMPKWLFIHHARRHGWTTKQLTDPLVVYQLSLRMAVSYDATCFGLLAHKILDHATVEGLRSVAPKKSKRRALGHTTLEDSWADVWLLEDGDNGAAVEAGPHDMFVANLVEHAGSGYLWDTEPLGTAGFTVVENQAIDRGDPNAIGAHHERRVIFSAPAVGVHRVDLSERRPWDPGAPALKALTVEVSTFGAEVAGVPRRTRALLAQPLVH